MKKYAIIAALALTGALLGNGVYAEEPAPAPAPQPQQTEAQAANPQQKDPKAPFIIRRPLPKEQRAAKEAAQQKEAGVSPAVKALGNQKGQKEQPTEPGTKRPLKAWEQQYYEEHPEALKQDQEKGDLPEGKSRHRNNDDDYYNWHRL